MSRYIIREFSPEAADLSFYFDDDGLTERGGDYCYTLFIVPTRNYMGFNVDEYERVQKQLRDMLDDFDALRGDGWYAPTFDNFKQCMEYHGIRYNSRLCHEIKEWSKNADESEPEDVARFLTYTTGKKWKTSSASGYSQGDYVEMVYCPEHYKNGVRAYGEVWLGCAKEFEVIELDDDGEEIDACGGYIVADCEANSDADYKRIVAEWAGIDENAATLEMIDDCYTVTRYKYRTA